MTQQEWPTDAHLLKVYILLGKLKIGEAITIADHAPNKPELFIKCCSLYFSIYGNIEINNSKTEIRKTSTFNEKIK